MRIRFDRPERRARAESVGGEGKEIKERAAAGEPRKGHGSRRGEGRRRPRAALRRTKVGKERESKASEASRDTRSCCPR